MTDAQLYEKLSEFLSENKQQLFERLARERTRHVTVVLEDIYQSHNASAVVRTCDLLGIQDLHIIEERNTYTLNKEVTMGSSKWVDLHRYREGGQRTEQCLRSLRAKGYTLVATSPRATDITPESIPLDRPLAFCFGTELKGATDVVMEMADIGLRIPMHGFTESYNISVSAAIVLYTVMQRLRASEVPWRLSETAVDALKLHWARKAIHDAQGIEARWKADEGK